MCCGWTWEYIDEFVTVPRVLEMGEYWRIHPPLHELYAAVHGYKPAPAPASEESGSRDDSETLLRDLMASGIAMPGGLMG